ncbi:MAG: outer membrane beta-barrel protein [Xanthobacteraceae bacterium]|nr:outer membrane beta-barrel protein [Xanthobacteraceae bacterium]
MLAPVQGGFAPMQDSPLRRVGDTRAQTDLPSLRQTVSIDSPAASGAGDTGYDSLNRTRKRPKPYPGTPKPAFVGPGNPANPPPLVPPRVTPPVSPSFNGTADGQPPRRRLRTDEDPFGQVGNYVGGFLVKEAVEVSGGYDTNPARFQQPRGSSFYLVAPELQATSDWTRHALNVDLRGTYTGYGKSFPPNTDDCASSGCTGPLVSPAPIDLDRPDLTGRINGRLDVSRDTRITSELRLRVGTDNPTSPNVAAGLEKYPIYTTVGGTVGAEQDFNRLQVQVNGNVDRTQYQFSQLTDGTSASNDDRNFNQYGGQGRISYDWRPGVKPFIEVEGDSRVHDLNADFEGFQRNSTGGYIKGGSSFEFSRLLTGEFSVGWTWRDYQDPRLKRLDGLLTTASLVWTATGLTTVRFTATSSIDETTLADVSGSLSRDYNVQVDHAFRRWLIGTGKFGYGTTDYQGTRFDKRYYVEGDLTYRLTRTLSIKGTVRHDWLVSDVPNVNSNETIVMLGVRIQR